MKPRRLSAARLSFPLAAAIAAMLSAQPGFALTYYWDNNGTTAGFGTAAGTWAAPTTGSATQGWSQNTGGTVLPVNVTTATADTVNFGNAATGLAAGTITVSGSVSTGNMTFASGSGAITLSGGTINLGGSRTITSNYTAGVNVNRAITSELALSGASTFTIGDTGAGGGTRQVTLGVLSGTGGTTFQYTGGNNGFGVILLNDASTYSGSTLISTSLMNANTEVRLGVNDALPTGTVLTIGGAAGTGSGRVTELNMNGKNQTLGGLASAGGGTLRTLTVNSSTAATLTVNDNSAQTFAGLIGTGGTNVSIVKGGSGTWTLTGANTYVGSTTLNQGTITVGAGGTLGATTGALIVNNNNTTVAGTAAVLNLATAVDTTKGSLSGTISTPLSGTNTATINTQTSRTFTVNQTAAGTYAGAINGAGPFTLGSLSTNTLTLTGRSTLTGNVTVSAGTLAAAINANGISGTATALGNSSTVGRTISVGTATLRFDSGNVLSTNFSSNAVPAITVTGGTLTNSGTATNNALGNLTLAGGTLSAVSGTGNTSGYGVWNLNGTVTSTGTSTISSASSFPITLSANVGNSNITSFDVTSGTLTVSAGLGEITATGDEKISGLTKSGAGTLILSGTNIYTGATTVSAGTLSVNGSLNNSPITLSAGTLTGSGTVGAVTVANSVSAILSNNSGTPGASLTTGALTFDGAATVNTFSSSTSAPIITSSLATNAAGTVTINPSAATWINGTTYNLVSYGGGSIGGAGFPQFALGPVSGLTARQSASPLANTGSAITFTISGDSPKWTGLDNGNWQTGTTGASSNWILQTAVTATDFINTDDVLFDDTAAGSTTLDIIAANVSPSSTTFNNSSKNYILTGGFGIASGSLTKNGSGSLTINNANSYAGGTILNAGILVLGGANAIGSGTLSLTGGSLDSSVADLVNAGNNAQAWNGDFAFTGSQNLNLGTGAVTMSANRTVTVNANTLTVDGIIGGGAVSLTKAGAGTLVLTAANTYSGGTTINASSGTLQATKNAAVTNAIGTGAVDVGAGSTLVLDITKTTNITDTIANTFTGSGLLKLQFAAGTTARNTSMPNVTGFTGTIQLSNLGTTGDKWNAASLGTVAGSLLVDSGSMIFVQTAPASFTGGITLNGAGSSENRGAIRLGATTLGGNISLASSSTISMESAALAMLTGNISSGVVGTQTLTLGGTASNGGTLSGIIGGGTGTIDLATAVGGTYTLTHANTYTGTTTIAASTTLQLGNGTSGNDGTISSTSGVTNNGTLAFNRFGTDTWVNAITGTGAVTKLGAGTQTLSGLSAIATNNYSGTTTINEGTLAFTTTNPTLTGGLRFGSANTVTTAGILDLTNASATFDGTLVVNTNSATANEIKIGAAQTLTINNNVQIGAAPPAVTGTVTRLNLTGGGAFNVSTAAAGTFNFGANANTSLSQDITLDLTALSATTINTTPTGTIRVNSGSGTNTTGTKATMLLPTPVVADTVATATLTAGTIGVGVGSAFNSGVGQINTLQLGTGLTTLNANTINVGTGSRDIGQIIFAGAGGDLKIRAADTTGRATALNVGTGGATTATAEATTNNLVDFSSHDADILVTSLNVGNQARVNIVNPLTSELKFGAGDASLASVLDATNVNIGFRTGTVTTTSVLTSRVNLSGGTVTFGNVGATGTGVDIGNSTYSGAGAASTIGELNVSGGTVTMNNSTSMGAAVRIGTNTSANGGTVTASLNLTGGTTTLTGDIVRGTATGAVTSTLKISGGTLDLGGNDIGTATELITLTAESGELKNVASINGNGGFTKTTSGTLTLTGLNTYTGNTVVDDGTFALADNAQLKFVLGATSGVNNSISGAGTVTLDGDFVIDTSAADALTSGSWTLENVPSLSGAYGASFTVAGFTDAGSDKWTKVTGAKTYTFDETTGILTLETAAGYASWAAINAIDSTPGQDKDGDGVNNAVEYVLGGLVSTNDLSKLPQSTISGTNMVFTFQRKVDTIDGSTVVKIEVGTTLAAWPTVYTVGADTAGSTPGVVVTEDSPGFDTIRLTVPMGTDPKKFARLNVEVP